MTQTQQEKILQATVKFWTDGNYIYQSDVKFWNNKVKRYLVMLAGMGVVVKAEDQTAPIDTGGKTGTWQWVARKAYYDAGFVKCLPLLDGEGAKK